MRLDIVRRFVARDGPSIRPVPRWFDAPGFQPQLERLSDDHRTGSVSRRRHIHERYEFTGKRDADLTEIRTGHDTTVSDRRRGFKGSVPVITSELWIHASTLCSCWSSRPPVDPTFGGVLLQRMGGPQRATSVLRGQFILAAIRLSAIGDNFSQTGTNGQVHTFSVSDRSVLLS